MKMIINGEGVNPLTHSALSGWFNKEPLTVQTSGTSGYPKLITHSYKVMREAAEGTAEMFGINQDSKIYCYMKQFNKAGNLTIGLPSLHTYLAAVTGCTLVWNDFNPKTFVEDLVRSEPTHMTFVPSVWKALHKTDSWQAADFSFLDLAFPGSDFISEAMFLDLESKGAKRVVCAYGSTEVPPNLMVGNSANRYSVRDKNSNVELAISDNQTLMSKYPSQEEWWDSEDVVEGTLEDFKLVGRKRNMFKLSCSKVFPETLETEAVNLGATLALCEKKGRHALLKYVGECDENKLRDTFKHIDGLKVIKVDNIKVDENLGKVLRK